MTWQTTHDIVMIKRSNVYLLMFLFILMFFMYVMEVIYNLQDSNSLPSHYFGWLDYIQQSNLENAKKYWRINNERMEHRTL